MTVRQKKSLVRRVVKMAKHGVNYPEMVKTLNDDKIVTGHGHEWTIDRLQKFMWHHGKSIGKFKEGRGFVITAAKPRKAKTYNVDKITTTHTTTAILGDLEDLLTSTLSTPLKAKLIRALVTSDDLRT